MVRYVTTYNSNFVEYTEFNPRRFNPSKILYIYLKMGAGLALKERPFPLPTERTGVLFSFAFYP